VSKIASQRIQSRIARHNRVRRKVAGTAERPRLCVRRSLNNVYAQIVDDATGRSLVQLVTSAKEVEAKAGAEATKTDKSRALGELIAEKAKALGISAIVFDRGGYLYHGRIKAVADGARAAGLEF
jgi:large subunit ribosomal protein L18